ncbi:glycoside hydrolase family 15 protein [Phycicoccus flavus]|uniref:glycoside hydrolase family 15 protein n=1 Tax=Phycicoccus flavus TaxID=2502783 RepID=UPI000FEBFB5C|nr:glycoside hydrolase family 15 protein [Phycicoccus flavus]NHA69425.1 glycoside hydrolase family 15 protein [Phycicoccus flavus]
MSTSTSSASPSTADQPEIGDHALLSDGRSMALVARDGTVDWWTMPQDPRLGLCDAVLDPDGGRFVLRPVADAEVTRRYVGASMVLETTFTTADGTLVVTDALSLHNGALLPWVELARRVHCRSGVVDVEWEFRPASLLGRGLRPFEEDRGRLRTVVDEVALAVQSWDAGDAAPDGDGVRGAMTMTAGQDALVAVVGVVGSAPLPRPSRTEVEARIGRTAGTWATWSEGVRFEGRWRDQVHTSARVLKALVDPVGGAILAAPTTSLPERIGGGLTWDYRYCWMRDASFTVDALLRVGMVEDAHAAVTALLRMAATTSPRLQPFYRVDGTRPEGTTELDLPGYRGSTPVRHGNSAVSQLQLGGWGDLLEALWIYVRSGGDLDADGGRVVAELTDELCTLWREPDAGIWELGQTRHYTISKMASWVAFDRALRLADAGQVRGDTARWAAERDATQEYVRAECWSQDRGTYTFFAGSDGLDAACLLAARTGFADPRGPEMAGTVRAVREELMDGPFVWRYSGQQDVEGAFLACSFWLAEALVRAGDLDGAAEQIDGTLRAANDLGLLAEEYDPAVPRLLGNFPQGLSHLALVNAAALYAEARDGRGAMD